MCSAWSSITGGFPRRWRQHQNAKNSDRQNAKIEHDKALQRVITALFRSNAQLFKQFQDNNLSSGSGHSVWDDLRTVSHS